MQMFLKTVSLALICYVIFKTPMILQPQALTNLNMPKIHSYHLTLIPALFPFFPISVNGIFSATQTKQHKTKNPVRHLSL